MRIVAGEWRQFCAEHFTEIDSALKQQEDAERERIEELLRSVVAAEDARMARITQRSRLREIVGRTHENVETPSPLGDVHSFRRRVKQLEGVSG